MNVFALSGLLTFLTSIFFAVFSWAQGNRSLTRIWGLFCLTVAIWGYGAYAFSSASAPYDALCWLRIGHIGVILMPVFFWHFVVEFLEIKASKRLLLVYALGLFFLCLNATDSLGWTALLIAHLRFVFSQFYVDSPPAPLYPAFLCFYFGTIIYAHVCIITHYASMSSRKRLQVKYFLLATILGFAGGITAFFMVFGLDIYPYYHMTVPLYPIIMSYAIVRYRLMDIEVIIKKTLVFAGLFTVFMGVVSTVIVLAQSFLNQYFKVGPIFSGVVGALIVMVFYDPTRQLLMNLTDKYLFQKKLDYQHLLRKASQGISRIRSLDQLSHLIVTFLTLRMRIENAAVFTKDAKRPVFCLKTRRGYGQKNIRVELLASSNLVSMLEHEKKPIRYEDVLEKLQGRQNLNGIDYGIVKDEMNEMKAGLVVPSFRGSVEELSNGTSSYKKDVELVHLLILGKKKSDEIYTEEDVDIFFTIAQESAIAIENARLYDEVVARQREAEKAREEALVAKRKTEEMELELIRREKMVFVEKLVKGIAHEINNPMHTAGNQIEAVEFVLNALREFRMTGAVGLSDEQLMFLDEQLDSLAKAVVLLNDITGHVAKITETLNTMQRPEDDSIQAIDFKTYWVAAVPMIEAQSHGDLLNSVPIKVNIQRGIPLVKANSSQLTQIFLNLYRNSLYALRGRENKTVILRAEPDPDDNRLLKLKTKTQ